MQTTTTRTKVTNIVELRQDLLDLYQDCRDKKVSNNEARKCTDVANTILRSVAEEIKYAKEQGFSADIEFMNVNNEK